MILGIDVSTSITGFAVVGENQIVYYDSVDLRKEKDIFAKAVAIKEKLLDIFEAYQCGSEDTFIGNAEFPIVHIYIEQPFTFFNSGGSSAQTMAKLQKFNGIVSWLTYEVFEIKPEYVTAQKARKLAGIKVPRGQKAKQIVLEYLLDNEPAFKID
ncbi:hypothetical protein CMI47_18465, partial [Candidatus Pacearchaeota archaeon]|nr:hypothetical protein [Candidatus Pacearchaeota archaeon]